MKPEELEPNIYRRVRLTRAVWNRNLDKRIKHDVEHLPWQAGDVFRIDWHWLGDGPSKRLFSLVPVQVAATDKPRGYISGYDAAWPDLLEALELVPPTARDLFRSSANSASNYAAFDFIDYLLDTGVLTVERIVQLQAEQQARDDAEDARREAERAAKAVAVEIPTGGTS